MLFVIFLIFIFIVVGALLRFKKEDTQKNPSLLGSSSLLLQLLLIVLFITGVLENFNETLFDLIWWSTVICGLTLGIREFKSNIIVSLLNILLSILLAIFMLLLLFITSM
ncbi:hypothetical protein [Sporosarcina sp. A2]|uniref:hypothetical protein n=1 Tax=Sporosarcina sp. A2 TaxID=3393449 RepID=UPI003D7C07A8